MSFEYYSKKPEDYYGRKIVRAFGDEDSVRLTFEDGTRIKIYDNGQSCCEHRYMKHEDDLSVLEGSTLLGIQTKDGGCEDEGYDVHEIEFLEIQSTNGYVNISNHNEHNGYYGGFSLSIEEIN